MDSRFARLLLASDAGDGGGKPPAASGKITDAPAAGKDAQDKGATPSPAGDDFPDDPVKLKATVSELREQTAHLLQVHNEMKEKYRKREEADTKAQQEELKKSGQFQALYETAAPRLEALELQVKRQESVLNSIFEAELKSVPDNFRVLIPEGDPVSKLEWITKAKAAGAISGASSAPQAAAAPAGARIPPPGSKGGIISKAQFLEMKPADRARFMASGGSYE